MDCSQPGSSICGILQARSTGVGSCFLFQGIFLPQGLNPSLTHWRQILYHLSHQGSTDNKQFELYRVSLVPSMFWWPIHSSDRKTFCKNNLFKGLPSKYGQPTTGLQGKLPVWVQELRRACGPHTWGWGRPPCWAGCPLEGAARVCRGAPPTGEGSRELATPAQGPELSVRVSAQGSPGHLVFQHMLSCDLITLTLAA